MATLFDQTSSLNRMLASLQTKVSANNIVITSTSVPIVSILAEEIAQVALANAYYTRETKWDKAQNIASLIYQGRFRGYASARKQGALGQLIVSSSVSWSAAHGVDISIPKYTKFTSASGLTFSSVAATTLEATDLSVSVSIVQGTPKSYTYTASGSDLEKIQLASTSMEETYYDVYVNGVLWTQVDVIEESASADKVYEMQNYGDFEGVDIIFGNDIYGKKLQLGDTVLIKYVETEGASGNVDGIYPAVTMTVASTLYDINGLAVSMYAKNIDPITGGKDSDTIEYIRRKGTLSFMGGDKAVTVEGYEYQIGQSQYVEKCIVWGAYEYNLDHDNDPWEFIPSNDNMVYVSAYSPLGEQLSDVERLAIITDLVDRKIKPPSDIISFVDAKFIGLEFHIDAYASATTVNLATLKTSIQTALDNAYGLEVQSFKSSLYDTQWKCLISDIEGISHHDSYIRLVDYPEFSSAYVLPITLLNTAITAGSLKIYAKKSTATDYTHITTCTANNTWSAQAGYTSTGSMDLTTGIGSVTLTGTIFDATYTNYDIKIYYIPTSLNFVPTERNEIFKIESYDDISVQYLS